MYCSLYVLDDKKRKSSLILVTGRWPGADPGVQAVSPQVTLSLPPGGKLPSLSAKRAVTFPAKERHHPSAGTKLYCLVTYVLDDASPNSDALLSVCRCAAQKQL